MKNKILSKIIEESIKKYLAEASNNEVNEAKDQMTTYFDSLIDILDETKENIVNSYNYMSKCYDMAIPFIEKLGLDLKLKDSYFDKNEGVVIMFTILGSENWSEEMGEEYKEKIENEFKNIIPRYSDYEKHFWIGLELDTVSELYVSIEIPIDFTNDLEDKIKNISYYE